MVSGRLAARMVHAAVMEDQGELGYRCRHPGFPLASLAGERPLPLSRFAIVLDLSGARLTQIDDGIAREMARRDFGALIDGSLR